jgi:heptosyltransferase III
MQPRRNVLIFHSAALGDFVLTWPLALALSRLYPQSRVIYVTQRQKGLLAEAVLGVESVDAEQGWHVLYSEKPKLTEGMATLLGASREVYTFNATEDDEWTKNVTAAMLATIPASGSEDDVTVVVTHLPTKPRKEFTGTFGEYLAGALSDQPVMQSAVVQILASIAARGLAPGRVVGDLIVVHPGAGSVAKCWPADRFVELVRRLRAAGRHVAVVLGEVEIERLGAEHVAAFEREAQVVRPQSYVELSNMLRGARGFVGNDAGPSHLAGVLGVATVTIFGPSDPKIWRPLGPNVKIVHEADLGALSAERVIEAVAGVM